MYILTEYEHDEKYWEWESYKIEVDGTQRVYVGRIEPEDATLTRDLSFAYDIVPLMKEAYEAGKRGEDFTVAGITDTKS